MTPWSRGLAETRSATLTNEFSPRDASRRHVENFTTPTLPVSYHVADNGSGVHAASILMQVGMGAPTLMANLTPARTGGSRVLRITRPTTAPT
jgi:hypothetical protein